jgi:hypothetical protein
MPTLVAALDALIQIKGHQGEWHENIIMRIVRMSYRHQDVAAALLSILILAPINPASAAESNAIPIRAPPVADAPFFFVNDNYLTYSYLPEGADPGVPGKTEKQVYSFSHFDVWAYGTNFVNLNLFKGGSKNKSFYFGHSRNIV